MSNPFGIYLRMNEDPVTGIKGGFIQVFIPVF